MELATLHFHGPFDVRMAKEQLEENTGITNIPGSSFRYSFIQRYTYFSLFFSINYALAGLRPAGLEWIVGRGHFRELKKSHASLCACGAQLGGDLIQKRYITHRLPGMTR